MRPPLLFIVPSLFSPPLHIPSIARIFFIFISSLCPSVLDPSCFRFFFPGNFPPFFPLSPSLKSTPLWAPQTPHCQFMVTRAFLGKHSPYWLLVSTSHSQADLDSAIKVHLRCLLPNIQTSHNLYCHCHCVGPAEGRRSNCRMDPELEGRKGN